MTSPFPFALRSTPVTPASRQSFKHSVLSGLSIADNMFLGREICRRDPLGRMLRQLDRGAMERAARKHLSSLGLLTVQNIKQAVETLSGGQRQGVAVARAAAFGSRVIILDEPTAALGVKESPRRVMDLIVDVKRRGLAIVLIDPQHAASVRACRSHSRHASRTPHRTNHPDHAFHVGRGCDHDRSDASS